MFVSKQAPARSAVSCAVLACLSAVISPAFSQPSSQTPSLQAVDVVGTTPLPGLGQPLDEIASPVQTLNAAQLEVSPGQSLADVMNQNLGSVHINDNQGNPFAADVSYRGFTASPLLGTPQGLSVYVDGVRMNQPFGDVVNWDVIPRGAIQSLTLIPGSNPLFGLNTLGGAISIQTKDGLSAPGTRLEVSGGAHNRGLAEFQSGGSNAQGFNWYVLGSRFTDKSWRDASTSAVNQLFSKLGWKQAGTDVQLTLAATDAQLLGGGLQQSELLSADARSVFTKPDMVNNRSQLVNLALRHALNDQTLFSGNLYWRQTQTHTVNGDINEESFNQDIYNVGEPGVTALNQRYSSTGFFPSARCLEEAGTNEEPNEKCNALYNTSSTTQSNAGLSGQFTFLQPLAQGMNNLVVGAALDRSTTRFSQQSQFGYLNPDRSLATVNAFANGTQASEDAFDQRVELSASSRTVSAFASNTLSQGHWHWSASARMNSTFLDNNDHLLPSVGQTTQAVQGVSVARKSLTESHSYHRINPSLGLSFTPSAAFKPYASYSESSRAPTAIELGCADPEFGCRLPNSMAGDPYLAQVVSRTFELGARGRSTAGVNWSLSAFRTTNSDDILFVANSASTGYFKNFGQTQRQGLELSLSRLSGAWSYAANFTVLDATFASSETVNSPFNSTADAAGNITIKPGDRLPLIPQQMLKLRVSYQFSPELRSGLQLIAVGESFARGNDNNQHVSGVANGKGVATEGSGRVPGYAVVNWTANYAASRQLSYFSSVTNLFNQTYVNAGQLGPAAFRSDGGYTNGGCTGSNPGNDGACAGTMFYAPGAPRLFWVGLRYMM